MDGEGTTAMRTQGLSKVGLEHLHEVMAGHVGAGRAPGLVLALSRGADGQPDAIGGAAGAGRGANRPGATLRITSRARPRRSLCAPTLVADGGRASAHARR